MNSVLAREEELYRDLERDGESARGIRVFEDMRFFSLFRNSDLEAAVELTRLNRFLENLLLIHGLRKPFAIRFSANVTTAQVNAMDESHTIVLGASPFTAKSLKLDKVYSVYSGMALHEAEHLISSQGFFRFLQLFAARVGALRRALAANPSGPVKKSLMRLHYLKTFCNIVEDCRIERKIIAKSPGFAPYLLDMRKFVYSSEFMSGEMLKHFKELPEREKFLAIATVALRVSTKVPAMLRKYEIHGWNIYDLIRSIESKLDSFKDVLRIAKKLTHIAMLLSEPESTEEEKKEALKDASDEGESESKSSGKGDSPDESGESEEESEDKGSASEESGESDSDSDSDGDSEEGDTDEKSEDSGKSDGAEEEDEDSSAESSESSSSEASEGSGKDSDDSPADDSGDGEDGEAGEGGEDSDSGGDDSDSSDDFFSDIDSIVEEEKPRREGKTVAEIEESELTKRSVEKDLEVILREEPKADFTVGEGVGADTKERRIRDATKALLDKKPPETMMEAVDRASNPSEAVFDPRVAAKYIELAEDKFTVAKIDDGMLVGRSFAFVEPRITEDEVEVFNHFKSIVTPYAKSFREIFTFRLAERMHRFSDLRTGRLHRKKLATAMTTDRVFYTEEHIKTTGVSLCVLLDESGSMGEREGEPSSNPSSWTKATKAFSLAMLVQEALKPVPMMDLHVYSHGSFGPSSKDCLIKHLYGGDLKDPKRLACYRGSHQNYDHVAIRETFKRFRIAAKYEKQIFFYLADGEPCGEGYYGYQAIRATRAEVAAIEKAGAFPICFAIEAFDVKQMFKHYVVFNGNFSEFVAKVRGILTALILAKG
jgi:nitric oxide reductase activation protein